MTTINKIYIYIFTSTGPSPQDYCLRVIKTKIVKIYEFVKEFTEALFLADNLKNTLCIWDKKAGGVLNSGSIYRRNL